MVDGRWMFRVGSGEVWRKGSMRVRERGLSACDFGGQAGVGARGGGGSFLPSCGFFCFTTIRQIPMERFG